jgi:hypothetical protein
MINFTKSTIKLPLNGYSNILDVGNGFLMGNYTYNKNLTITRMDALSSYQNNTAYYDRSFPLCISGNNCCLNPGINYYSDTTGTTLSYMPPGGYVTATTGSWNSTTHNLKSKPSSWQTFMSDTYSMTFTSTMGATNGTVFVCDPVTMYQRNPDSTISWPTNLSLQANYNSLGFYAMSLTAGGILATYPYILGENADSIYLLCNYNAASYQNLTTNITGTTSQYLFNMNILRYNKSTGVVTTMISTTSSTATSAMLTATSAFKVMPTTSDNKIVITCYNTPANSLNTTATTYHGFLGYIILDLTANTVTASGARYQYNTQNTVGTCMVPSTWSVDPVTTTNYKYYVPVCDATNTVATKIARVTAPVTWGSKTAPVVGDFTTCTLTNISGSIPNPNSTPTNTNFMATSACFYLNQQTVNSSEYCVLINMGYANVQDGGVGYKNQTGGSAFANGCDVNRHCLFVFKIDPTNSANLIYKSSSNDGTAFGTNAVLYNINASTDKTVFVLSNYTQFVILTWNSVTESYATSSVYTIPTGIRQISLDASNQIWIHNDSNFDVYVYSLTGSVNTVIGYTGGTTAVDYVGTNLSQNVTINCYDLLGNRLAKSVTLNVSGPAVFTSTQTTTVTITTLTSADTLAGLTINGPGQIIVTPVSTV